MKPVFIFGSNLQGFHGAGAAAYAFMGDSKANWRKSDLFRQAMAHGPGFLGKYAVFGQAKGFQQGTDGASYAIVTVTKPGLRRSVSLDQITSQTVDLKNFISDHADWQFHLSPFGVGYAGMTIDEMRPLYRYLLFQANCKWGPETPEFFVNATT